MRKNKGKRTAGDRDFEELQGAHAASQEAQQILDVPPRVDADALHQAAGAVPAGRIR
ncbi:hypothetical protein E4U42_007479, partial [Claviceps africana]